MKKTLIFLALYSGSLLRSQTNRFTYELQYRENASQQYTTTLMNLDINPGSVKFYDKSFADYDEKIRKQISRHHDTVQKQTRLLKENLVLLKTAGTGIFLIILW